MLCTIIVRARAWEGYRDWVKNTPKWTPKWTPNGTPQGTPRANIWAMACQQPIYPKYTPPKTGSKTPHFGPPPAAAVHQLHWMPSSGSTPIMDRDRVLDRYKTAHPADIQPLYSCAYVYICANIPSHSIYSNICTTTESAITAAIHQLSIPHPDPKYPQNS